MERVTLKSRRRLAFMLFVFEFLLLCLIFRIFYIQYFKGPFYQKLAFEQQTRDRLISPVRGQILDRNNTPIATSKSVSAISVIHAQVKEPEKVAKILSEKLDLDYTETLEKINKRVALMRIKTKVDKAKGKEISDLNLKGVVVDEDIQRIYPFNNLASHVIGFVGKDTLDDIDFEDYYELLDLEIGKCYFAVAAYPEYRNKVFNRRKKIASKYTNVAKKYFASKQEDVEIIKLEGSVELGPVTGISDAIVDIVETGSTLKANGLEVIEKVSDISTRMIVNKVAFKFKKDEIMNIVNQLEKVIGGN